MRVNGIDFKIVGILPPAFTGPDTFIRPDFYVPLMMWSRLKGGDPLSARDLRTLDVKGRLKPGVSMEQANAEAADCRSVGRRVSNDQQRLHVQNQHRVPATRD